ncbi:HAD family hydrolase [Thermoactinospora rubra]|uniref:HAD family hydrolase n=1 Tax=Thermoactinospora rubra TaxID=1088767 RepID=UPI000A100C31|nr:HAD family phosphatase [Thermoactinospora rubra]
MIWIVFDYGNVLSLPQSPEENRAMARAAGADPHAFERGYWEHRLEFDRAALTPEEYWSKVLGRQATDAELARLVEMDVASWSHPNHATLEVTGELAAAGRRLALLSNAPACVADGIDGLPWLAPFEPRVYSARIGMVKPDVEIYEHLLARLGAESPRDVVFVDDRLENVHGAERAGLTGVHFTGAERLRADLALL